MKTPLRQFPNFHVLDHPLIQHKLSLMRDKAAPTILFRQLLKEIALLMGYEVMLSPNGGAGMRASSNCQCANCGS